MNLYLHMLLQLIQYLFKISFFIVIFITFLPLIKLSLMQSFNKAEFF